MELLVLIEVLHFILIHGHISIHVKPLDGTAVYGDGSYTIECTLSGTGAKTWLWSKSSITGGTTTTISTGGKYSIVIYTTATNLTINNVVEEDEQDYFCQAIITVGLEIQTRSRLIVNGGFPIVVISPTDADVFQGQSQLITCTVVAEPAAVAINWYFTPHGSERQQKLSLLNTAKYSGGNTLTPSLTVLNFQSSDSGNYVCVATNGVGRSSSTYCALRFIIAPKVPVLTGPSSLISGSSGTWTCFSINGYPAPNISMRIQDKYYTNDLIILQSYNVMDRSYTVTGTLDLVLSSDKSGQNLCCDVIHLFNKKVPQSVCIQLTINDKEEQSVIVYVVIGCVALLLLFVLIIAIICYRNGCTIGRSKKRGKHVNRKNESQQTTISNQHESTGNREQRNRERVYYGLDPNQKEEVRVYYIPREDDDNNHYMTIPGDLHNTYIQPISEN